MYRIRYYDRMFHPDHFKRGLRGWFIVALNWVRWRLETFIQFRVLKFICREGQVISGSQRSLMEMFRLDVEAERLEKSMTSPHLLPVEEPPMPESIPTRAEKYQEGSQRSVLDTFKAEGGPVRPESLDAIVARWGQATQRQRRYGKGRRHTVLNPDGDFEAVPTEGTGRGES